MIPRKGGRLRVTPYGKVPVWRVMSLDMKKILYLAGMVTMLSTSGCIFPEGDRGRHEHARYEHHDSVVVGPPVIVVRPPEVIVR
jgi:hypothetical protein